MWPMIETDEEEPDEEPDEGYDAFRQGYYLHRRGRRTAEAEAAYRRAIANGYPEAWLNLAMLIAGRGRTDEEEAAYRAAMSCDDDASASRAALRLGELLDNLRRNLADAQACFEFARDHGSGHTRLTALLDLAALLAYQGQRQAAEKEVRSYLDERYPEDDGDSFHVRLARAVTWAAYARGTRSLLRTLRVTNYRASRRVTGLRVVLFGGHA
jgi:tetratricopeptide (TPR) repeat protein